MTKKKFLNQNMFINFVSIVLFVPTIISVFLNIFNLSAGNSNSSIIVETYKLFANYDYAQLRLGLFGKELQPIWMLINNIALLITVALILGYILIFILKVFNYKPFAKSKKLLNILGILILISSVIMFSAGTIATIVNHAQPPVGTSYVEIAGEIGLFLQLPALFGGIVTLFAKK